VEETCPAATQQLKQIMLVCACAAIEIWAYMHVHTNTYDRKKYSFNKCKYKKC